MLDQGTASLQTAWRDGWALGAFSTSALEQTRAICDPAEAPREPVMPEVFRSADLTALLGTARKAVQEVVETKIRVLRNGRMG